MAPPPAEGKLDLDAERQKPLGQRSEKWWNLIAVVGGALSGWIWFTYASVRGAPQLFGQASRESWLDFLPALLLLAVPILLMVVRRTAFKRFQQIPLVLKIIGGLAIAAFAYWVRQAMAGMGQREGLDFDTPLLMLGIPVAFMLLRRPIDWLLRPLQSIRKRIPTLVLLGIGLAIPFLTAYLLYNGAGMRQYPLVRWNVFIGLILSYVVLRTPKPAPTPARS